MFTQKLILRLLPIVAVLATGMVTLAYATGQLSNDPLYVAYVDQTFTAGDSTSYAYLVDPIRRLNRLLELPSQLTSSFYYSSPFEPNYIFVAKNVTNLATNQKFRRVYRYDFRDQSIETIYEMEYEGYIPQLVSQVIEFDGVSDIENYVIRDKLRHAIVLVDRKTLETHVFWQGTELPGQQIDYTLRNAPSPAGDKSAILDTSEGVTVTIATAAGEPLNEFQVTDFPESVATSSLLWINWIDNTYLHVTTLDSTGVDAAVPIYDTFTGEANPFTKSLHAFSVQPIFGCQDPWIYYSQRLEGKSYQAFTMNLATGTTYEQATYTLDTFTGYSGVTFISNQDCSWLLHETPGTELETSNIYRTTLTGDQLVLLKNDVLSVNVIDKSTYGYSMQNESGNYDIYSFSIDDLTSEKILTDLPTPATNWLSRIIDRGWYVFQDNQWNRTPAQFPRIPGNALLYYDVYSHHVHVLTPPDVQIIWAFELP